MNTHQPNFKIGILSALAAAIFLSLLNVFAKILSQDLSPIIVTFWRNIVALSILLAFLILFKKTSLMKTTRLKGQFIRAILGTIGIVMAVWTFQKLPITEATVINFSSPFFVLIMAYPLLGEKVGPYRILATLFGFIGVIVVIGFDSTILTPKNLMIAFGWVFANSLVLIMLRQLGKSEQAITTVFYFLTIGLGITSPYLPFADQIMPSNTYYMWSILGIGIVGLLSLWLKTESYRHAPANVITPISYTILLWSAIFDQLIWGHIASPNIWIGAGIIITSNFIIIWREHKLSKKDETLQV